VTIRPATSADRDTIRGLRDELQRELAKPPFLQEPWESVADDVDDVIREGVAVLAEEGGRAVGYALAEVVPETPVRAHLYDLFVAEQARDRGIGRALVGEVARRMRERGVSHLSLDVAINSRDARRLYERLGFVAYETFMVSALDDVERGLGARGPAPSAASTHVQSDDLKSVERAVAQFLPRLGGSAWTEVAPASNGWIAIADERCDRDREAQRRFAAELSDRLGAIVVALRLEEEAVVRYLLFERGRMVDEYLSVPSYYGPLNKADELSLAANATLVSRLTGADPARVRGVARVASSPAELPPARELLDQVAGVLGLEPKVDR
jgi:ribosomal protein S18 acetylase RimI-like enzyme